MADIAIALLLPSDRLNIDLVQEIHSKVTLNAKLGRLFETPEWLTYYRLTGVATRLGSVPRPVLGSNVSRDLRLTAMTTRDHKGDAWMARVVLVGSK